MLKAMQSTFLSALQRLWLAIATGFGAGRSRWMPGTVGTLPGLPLAWAAAKTGVLGHALLAVAMILPAIPICGMAERHFGRKDDRRIVADEYLTFPLTMIGVPITPWTLLAAFFFHRFFDVLKLPPARQMQRLPGGWGIVLDDAVSGLQSLAANHLLYWTLLRSLSAQGL